MDFYNFYTGREQNAWKWMGAHTDGQETVFRTFAPAAAGVSVVTDTGEYPMYPVHDGNFYEQTLTDMGPGKSYEYRIYQADGQVRDHCDPYGFGMELRPAHRIHCTGSVFLFFSGPFLDAGAHQPGKASL